MNREICNHLHVIERHFNVRVLMAVESGSRAWGFASPDSDYDVRFVYARAPQDYMRLTKVPDVIDTNYTFTLDEEAIRQAYPNTPVESTFEKWQHPLDFSGWDVRKFLTAARDTNPSTYEWFNSPLPYVVDSQFVAAVRPALVKHFNSRKAFHHYRNMGVNAFTQAKENNKVKSALYAFRSLLAAHYVYRYRSMPPVPLYDLVAAFSVRSEPEFRWVGQLYSVLLDKKIHEDAELYLEYHTWGILETLDRRAKDIGSGNDVWGVEPPSDFESNNSTLLAFSKLLEGQYASWKL